MTTRFSSQSRQPPVSRRAMSYAMLALVPALMLAGCDGTEGADASAPPVAFSEAASGEAVADSADVDAVIEDTPCELLTADMVASVFQVPATELEQSRPMASSCAYAWYGEDRELDVSVDVMGVHEDARAAASQFRSVTAGMSGARLDRAMDGIKEEAAREGALDTAGTRQAADALLDAGGSGGSDGIRFKDVEGVGDQARLALTVGAGDLYVRAGNLNFTVSAYSGPGMPMPDNPMEIMSASKAWERDTLPQREQAAVKLAEAVVASL